MARASAIAIVLLTVLALVIPSVAAENHNSSRSNRSNVAGPGPDGQGPEFAGDRSSCAGCASETEPGPSRSSLYWEEWGTVPADESNASNATSSNSTFS